MRAPLPVEVTIALWFLLITLIVGLLHGLPFKLPSGERASFVGVHYLYPLMGIGLLGAIMYLTKRGQSGIIILTSVPTYAIVLVAHFNLKLWIQHINPTLWDDWLWRTDEALRPLVDGAIAVRLAMDPIVDLDGNFYMIGFIAMFYLTFVFAWIQKPKGFRELFVAVLILQILGTIGYIAMPALGPFLFEEGVESMSSAAQAGMLAFYNNNGEFGIHWLGQEGGRQLTAGLAAMPSLHTGASFLFLAFAIRHRMVVLAGLLTPLFIFIAIDAVANRWHYVLDLPIGIFFAWIALQLSAHISTRRMTPARAEMSHAGSDIRVH